MTTLDMSYVARDTYKSIRTILDIIDEEVVRAVFLLVWDNRGEADAELAGDPDVAKRIEALDSQHVQPWEDTLDGE